MLILCQVPPRRPNRGNKGGEQWAMATAALLFPAVRAAFPGQGRSLPSPSDPAAATFQESTTKYEVESNAPFLLTPDSWFLLGSAGSLTADFAFSVML